MTFSEFKTEFRNYEETEELQNGKARQRDVQQVCPKTNSRKMLQTRQKGSRELELLDEEQQVGVVIVKERLTIRRTAEGRKTTRTL